MSTPDADPSVTCWHEATARNGLTLSPQEMSTSAYLRMQLAAALHDAEHLTRERDRMRDLNQKLTRKLREEQRQRAVTAGRLAAAVGELAFSTPDEDVLDRSDGVFCVDCAALIPDDGDDGVEGHPHDLTPVLVTISRRVQ